MDNNRTSLMAFNRESEGVMNERPLTLKRFSITLTLGVMFLFTRVSDFIRLHDEYVMVRFSCIFNLR